MIKDKNSLFFPSITIKSSFKRKIVMTPHTYNSGHVKKSDITLEFVVTEK